MRVALAFIRYKEAILSHAEKPKLEQAEQELREAIKNASEEDISYIVNILKDHVYKDEVLKKKREKLQRAEEFIESIREQFENFKL